MTFRQFEIDDVMKEHYRSARWTIAWLCLLLPFLSILFGFIGVLQGYNPAEWYHSISDTYYANSKAVMIGILSITAFYFATYKGYDIRDRIINILSAICAAGVALFPNKGIDGLIQMPKAGGTIHCVFALVLYLTFFLNCIWLFRLGNSNTREKKIRNKIYLGCGIGIAVAAGVLIAGNIFNLKQYIPNFIWIAEVVAQIAYAIAWFTKSGKFIKDKEL